MWIFVEALSPSGQKRKALLGKRRDLRWRKEEDMVLSGR